MKPGKIYAALVALLSLLFAPSISASVSLSHQDAMRIGRKIWQNECGGTVAGLTSWNAGENFASLGIGHFIWYPAGARGPFEESFPEIVRYVGAARGEVAGAAARTEERSLPMEFAHGIPQAESSAKMKQLRIFLADTIDLQADFLVERLREALPKMLAAAPPEERGTIQEQFDRVASSAQGCYALIDYVNFKGEGVLATERYRGRGWGLLQVLEECRARGWSRGRNEFADSAASVLATAGGELAAGTS